MKKILLLEKLKLLPKILIIILFSGVILYFGVLKNIQVYFSSDVPNFKVHIHYNDGDFKNSLLTNLVRSQSSISSFITVEETPLPFSISDADVYIDVPEDFIDKILKGENESATINFKSNSYYERIIFTSIAKSASEVLASAQSSIYAAEDMQSSPKIESVRDSLNENLLRASLERDSIFKSNSSGFLIGDLTGKAIVAILFLSLIPIGEFWTRQRREINRALILKGYSPMETLVVDFTGILLCYIPIGILIYILGKYMELKFSILGIFLVVVFIASLGIFLSEYMVENTESKLIGLFLTCLLTLGIIIPIEILPSPIEKVFNLLPQNLGASLIVGKKIGLLLVVYIALIFMGTYRRRR